MVTIITIILIVCANLVMYRIGYIHGLVDAHKDITEIIDEAIKEIEDGQKADSKENTRM